MVHFCGPERRIFSCAHRPRPPPLPQVRLSREGISILRSPIWPLSRAPCLHTVCADRPGPLAAPGAAGVAVSGRLATDCTLSNAGGSRYPSAVESCDSLGLYHQLGKKLAHSLSVSRIHWNDPGFQTNVGLSHSDQTACHQRHPCTGPQGPALASSDTASPCRASCCSNIGGEAWSPASAPLSALAAVQAPLPCTPQVQPCAHIIELCEGTTTMAARPSAVRWCATRAPATTAGGGDDGRFLNGMGGRLEPPGNTGKLGTGTPLSAHKPVGAASCVVNTSSFQSRPEREACVDSNRQHFGGVLHQPSGGDTIWTVPSPDTEASHLGGKASAVPQSSTYPGDCKLHSGRPLSGRSACGRLVSQQRRSSDVVEDIRNCGSRPVRHPAVVTVPVLVFGDGRARVPGPRCSGPRLAQLPALCIPPSVPRLDDSSSHPGDGMSRLVDCPSPAIQTVVSPAVVAAGSPALPLAEQEGSPVPNTRDALASPPREVESVGVAAGPDRQLMDCSQGVRNTVLNARAPSTRSLYNNRWKLFSAWCSERSLDPQSCPVPRLLDYLQSLLDSGKSPATLKVYVAAIAAHHALIGGVSVGSHKLVTAFLKGAFRLCPPSRLKCPQWDLLLVLNGLCEAPFEPLETCDIKWLSYKTAFLLAITSAKRVCEIHALSVSPQCMRWGPEDSSVTLWPNPAFLPKVMSPQFINRPFSLAVFDPASESTRALCPIRALKRYVSVTSPWRASDQLFVCFGGRNRGAAVSKQRLSHWVTETISVAYQRQGQTAPAPLKGHSTRAVATSWAALGGAPLSDICSAATWSSPSTFTRFYRLNVASPPLTDMAVLRAVFEVSSS